MDHVWTCRCCGKQFKSLPLDYALSAPDPWLAIPEAEREKRARLNSDVCIIDKEEFYLRGCLDIPILGSNEVFIWGVWVSLSRASFVRVNELWNVDVSDNEPPLFGWLCNELPVYPQTLGLKTNVHLHNHRQRPFIEVEPTDHPLAQEQQMGISLQRVEEIAMALLPRH
jgi:hypothetical protein